MAEGVRFVPLGGLMGRISAKGDDRSIRLIFNADRVDGDRERIRFLGYEIGGSRGALYSSLETLPKWARPRAGELVLHERDRLVASGLAEDIRQAIALVHGHRGRPRQTTCKRGHSLRYSYVGSDGRRHCRPCQAEVRRDVRTNGRKTAGQSTRVQGEIERVD
jgi:hypothetical protein